MYIFQIDQKNYPLRKIPFRNENFYDSHAYFHNRCCCFFLQTKKLKFLFYPEQCSRALRCALTITTTKKVTRCVGRLHIFIKRSKGKTTKKKHNTFLCTCNLRKKIFYVTLLLCTLLVLLVYICVCTYNIITAPLP